MERKSLPPLQADDRRGFESDVYSYRAGREEIAGRVLEPAFTPPWILVERFGGSREAGVVAVTMLPPAKGADEEPWLIRGVLRLEGPPVLSFVAVEHFPDGELEPTGYVLRSLRLPEIRNRAAGLLRSFPAVLEGKKILGYVPASREEAWARRIAGGPPLKRGRKGYPDEHYERIAHRYLELAETRRDVIKRLAEEEKRPYHTVRGWIARCVQKKLLAPAKKQGAAGYRPGPDLDRREPGSSDAERR